MSDRLDRYRILLAENDDLAAATLGYELAELGASIVGPVANMRDSVVLMVKQGQPDGALLNIGLGGMPAFPLADILMTCGVAIVFMANHYPTIVPQRFAHVPIYSKPVKVLDIAVALEETIQRRHACA